MLKQMLMAMRIVAYYLIDAVEIVLILRAVASWIPGMYNTKVWWFLYSLTEPMLAPIRRLLRGLSFMRRFPIDFSMLALFLLLEIVRALI